MGIEELINEYKQDKLMSRGFIVDDLGTETRAVYKEIDEVLEDLEQLKSSLPTQQDNVVVPPMIDEYLNVGNKVQKLASLVSNKYTMLDHDVSNSEIKQWLREISMDDLLSLANGYTVEKEQLYEVVFYEDESDRWLLMQLGENSYEIVPESGNDGYKTQWFTEEKIKAINEKYWVFRHPVDEQCQSFAVPVEEDE